MKNLKHLGYKFFAVVFLFAMFVIPTVASAAVVVAMFSPEAAVGGGATATLALNRFAEKELMKNFRHENTFLSVIPSKNNWVNNDIIDITTIGVDPAVLIDNTTYPISTSGRVDDSSPIKLKKFETENTKITDDELYALPYDKVGSVQEQHRLTLEEITAEYALHSLCASTNSANTPVLQTTGANDGTGRLRLVAADLITLKKKLDLLKVPRTGRVLVLCAEHTADLLLEDITFKTRYQNTNTGVIADNYYGFKVFEHGYNPKFDGTTLVKKAYAAVDASTDRNGSVVFLAQKSAKATGSIKRYLGDAASNPEMRETVVGFRLHHIVLPMQQIGQAAIIDGKAA